MPSSVAKGLIRPLHSHLQAFSRIIDAVLILVSLVISLQLYQLELTMNYLLPCLASIAFFSIFAEYNELYQGWRGSPMFDEALRILFSWFFAFGILAISISVYGNPSKYSPESTQLWLPLTPILIILLHSIRRILLSAFRQYGFNTRQYAILGANPLGIRLKQGLSEMPWLGYHFAGYFDDRAPDKERRLNDNEIGSLAGNFQELLQKAQNGEIDHIYITLPMCAEKRINKLIQLLADSTVSINLVPNFFTFNLIQSKWSNVQGIPVVSVFDTPFNTLEGTAKRIEDLALCAIILPLIAIPMLIISVAIKLTSPGPVIFKQIRYGVKGEQIEVWKFRSMSVTENGGSIKQATKNDARITPLGGFLRRTSLDELPQFLNVLQGSMSVVGPRPHAVAHNEYYRKQIQGYMLRHKVKPGITGQAQVNGCRGETDTIDKMQARIHHDLEYIKQWSLWLDIKIVFMTIFKGFTGNQAY